MTFADWQAARPSPPPPKPRRARRGPAQGSPVVVDGVTVGLRDRHLLRVVYGGGGDGVPTPDALDRVVRLTTGRGPDVPGEKQ